MRRRISTERSNLIKDVFTVLVFAIVTTACGIALMGWFGLLFAVGPLSMLISAAIHRKSEREADGCVATLPRGQEGND